MTQGDWHKAELHTHTHRETNFDCYSIFIISYVDLVSTRALLYADHFYAPLPNEQRNLFLRFLEELAKFADPLAKLLTVPVLLLHTSLSSSQFCILTTFGTS
jgi:hypothetical protein